MARYDSGIKFDDEVFYDDDEEESLPPHKKMADISRNWTRMNRAERMELGDSVVAKIGEGDKAVLPAEADFVAFSAKHTAAKAALATIKDLEDQLKAARPAAEAALDDWLLTMDQLARTGAAKAKGEAPKLVAMGWDVTEGGTSAPQPVGPVQGLVVTAGDEDGELDYAHERTVGAVNYERQTTTTPMDAASWVNRSTLTRSSGTIAGLPSGSRQWLRVRAVGPLGPGPWSDPASKTVP